MEALNLNRKYTYADILAWPEDERWELMDGVPYLMAQPNVAHERISREVFIQLANFLKGKSCEVFDALGVKLIADDDKTYLVPDITVICDKSKLADGKTCIGAPDMVMEITSPSTLMHDRLRKFNKYLQAGVREYWIVDPESKTVSVHTMENGKYVVDAYGETDTVPVQALEGCAISLPDVFSV